ncbi:hypothetical protein CORC01_14060 [Colletotrichum orchidophilum]|uniref:Uncharacterized protein n=1 Tax=Colletotrichum orchidophilum TaxID=1209926 RepID=A0A1G4ANE3_9PEZI|nr:uncharacterized protein CORC01_14060 [Colletotrichum orchidophilum]OHE90641.1 hypothetical protein CORC01_14060 [Colletotrichum orchidophilum]
MSTTSDNRPNGANWVEETNNPPPQVVVHSAPEAVSIQMNNLGIGNDGTEENQTFQSFQLGGDIDSANDFEHASPPPRGASRLWNWKTIIGICIGLLILAIVIPLTVTLSAKGHTSSGDNTENLATSSASSSSPSSTTTSSTSLPAPSSTSTPSLGCVESEFVQQVNWIGIDKSGGGWVFNLHPAKSAQDCCAICYLDTHDGCNGWLYIPENSSTPSCSIIHGFAGPNDGDSCPNGRPDIVFAKAPNKDSHGGPGPCAGSVRG